MIGPERSLLSYPTFRRSTLSEEKFTITELHPALSFLPILVEEVPPVAVPPDRYFLHSRY